MNETRLRKTFLSLLVALSLLTGLTATADTWAPSQPETTYSRNRQIRITIFPRVSNWEIQNRNPWNPDAEIGLKIGSAKHPVGVLERHRNGRYEHVWHGPLMNKWAPVEVLVSGKDGWFVTFDNWHEMGRGDDVMVIYNSTGDVVRKYSLHDFFTDFDMDKLPRSVSSIYWRGGIRLSHRDKYVLVDLVVPERAGERRNAQYKTAMIDFQTGAFLVKP